MFKISKFSSMSTIQLINMTNKKKKVLFVAELLNGRGGMENVTRQVIDLLNKDENISAGLYIIHNRQVEQSSAWSDNAVWGTSVQRVRNPKLSQLIHIYRLRKFIRKAGIDHVIALNTVPCFIARKAINLAGKRATLSSWMHLPPKARYRPHYLLLADHHYAISEGIKQQLIQLGVESDRIDTVYNPVTPTDIVLPRPETMKLLYVGRVHFEEQKQLKDLFDALTLLNVPWSLDIVGDGADRERCQKYAERCGIHEKIRWHGWQPHSWEYIAHNIKSVTALVLTSNHEGFPLVLLEAMSRGVFCISSDCVSGPSEIIIDGLNGHLYETNKPSHLARVLTNLGQKNDLPSQQVIKESIAAFYEDFYMNKFKKILQRVSGSK